MGSIALIAFAVCVWKLLAGAQLLARNQRGNIALGHSVRNCLVFLETKFYAPLGFLFE